MAYEAMFATHVNWKHCLIMSFVVYLEIDGSQSRSQGQLTELDSWTAVAYRIPALESHLPAAVVSS
jgi:hypothetical protein